MLWAHDAGLFLQIWTIYSKIIKIDHKFIVFTRIKVASITIKASTINHQQSLLHYNFKSEIQTLKLTKFKSYFRGTLTVAHIALELFVHWPLTIISASEFWIIINHRSLYKPPIISLFLKVAIHEFVWSRSHVIHF